MSLLISNHARYCLDLLPRFTYSLRNFFWSSCPHPANETGFLSNQYPPPEQHLFQTPDVRAIGTSFLLVSLSGEPILLCSPHRSDTWHCNNTVTRCWYFLLPSYVCWWGEQPILPDMQGNNISSLVSPWNFFKFLALLLIVLIDPAIPPWHCFVYTQRMGWGRRYVPRPHAVNITHHWHETNSLTTTQTQAVQHSINLI